MSKSRLLTPLLLGSITVVAALLPVSSAFAACSDCGWLFKRCMSRADTIEKAQECEYARADCEETFCTTPDRVSLSESLLPVSAKPSLLATRVEQTRDSRTPRRAAQ